MIYLDIIMTDKPDANEITPRVDHRAFLLKDTLKKPKLSFWDLYKLKKHLETGYDKLSEEITTREPAPAKAKAPTTKIQPVPNNTGKGVDDKSGHNTGGDK